MDKSRLLKAIQKRKQGLLNDLQRVKTSNVLEEDSWQSIDEIGDEARENQEKLTKQETVNLIQNRINILEQAEEDIEHGRYGICNKCGGKIEEERLLAMPEAQYCIRCQATMDR